MKKIVGVCLLLFLGACGHSGAEVSKNWFGLQVERKDVLSTADCSTVCETVDKVAFRNATSPSEVTTEDGVCGCKIFFGEEEAEKLRKELKAIVDKINEQKRARKND